MTRLKLSVVRYCADVANYDRDSEALVTEIVGHENEWCKHEVFVSGFADLLLHQKQYLAISSEMKERELCTQRKNDMAEEQQRAEKNRQNMEICTLRKLVTDTKNELLNEQRGHRECRDALAEVNKKLIDFETYIQSENGRVAMRLEEELAAAKLRIAELESEKDEWDDQYDDDDIGSAILKENVANRPVVPAGHSALVQRTK